MPRLPARESVKSGGGASQTTPSESKTLGDRSPVPTKPASVDPMEDYGPKKVELVNLTTTVLRLDGERGIVREVIDTFVVSNNSFASKQVYTNNLCFTCHLLAYMQIGNEYGPAILGNFANSASTVINTGNKLLHFDCRPLTMNEWESLFNLVADRKLDRLQTFLSHYQPIASTPVVDSTEHADPEPERPKTPEPAPAGKTFAEVAKAPPLEQRPHPPLKRTTALPSKAQRPEEEYQPKMTSVGKKQKQKAKVVLRAKSLVESIAPISCGPKVEEPVAGFGTNDIIEPPPAFENSEPIPVKETYEAEVEVIMDSTDEGNPDSNNGSDSSTWEEDDKEDDANQINDLSETAKKAIAEVIDNTLGHDPPKQLEAIDEIPTETEALDEPVLASGPPDNSSDQDWADARSTDDAASVGSFPATENELPKAVDPDSADGLKQQQKDDHRKRAQQTYEVLDPPARRAGNDSILDRTEIPVAPDARERAVGPARGAVLWNRAAKSSTGGPAKKIVYPRARDLPAPLRQAAANVRPLDVSPSSIQVSGLILPLVMFNQGDKHGPSQLYTLGDVQVSCPPHRPGVYDVVFHKGMEPREGWKYQWIVVDTRRENELPKGFHWNELLLPVFSKEALNYNLYRFIHNYGTKMCAGRGLFSGDSQLTVLLNQLMEMTFYTGVASDKLREGYEHAFWDEAQQKWFAVFVSDPLTRDVESKFGQRTRVNLLADSIYGYLSRTLTEIRKSEAQRSDALGYHQYSAQISRFPTIDERTLELQKAFEEQQQRIFDLEEELVSIKQGEQQGKDHLEPTPEHEAQVDKLLMENSRHLDSIHELNMELSKRDTEIMAMRSLLDNLRTENGLLGAKLSAVEFQRDKLQRGETLSEKSDSPQEMIFNHRQIEEENDADDEIGSEDDDQEWIEVNRQARLEEKRTVEELRNKVTRQAIFNGRFYGKTKSSKQLALSFKESLKNLSLVELHFMSQAEHPWLDFHYYDKDLKVVWGWDRPNDCMYVPLEHLYQQEAIAKSGGPWTPVSWNLTHAGCKYM